MMKAQGPKFETCLFGPGGETITVKPYREVLLQEKKEQEREHGKCDISAGSNNNASSNSNSSSNKDGKTPEMEAVEISSTAGTDGTLDVSVDAGGPLTDTHTPPQTPIKLSPPSRPIKPPSTAKKSKQRDMEVEMDLNTMSMNMERDMNDNGNGNGNDNDNSQQNHHKVNIQELRRLSSQGVPDDCTLRPLAWRIMLEYLPLDTSKWQETMDRDRKLYANLVQELFVLSEDYPFELEGHQLRGRGLKRDGEKVSILSPQNGKGKGNKKGMNGSGSGNGKGSGGSANRKSPMNSMMDAISKTNLLDEAEKDNIKRRLSGDEGVNVNTGSGRNLNVSTDATANGIEEDDDDDDENDVTNTNANANTNMKPEPELEIPQIIMDQWRKSGRDPESLIAGMGTGRKRGGIYRHINALLVTNNDTANAESNDASAVRKVMPLEELSSSESSSSNHLDEDSKEETIVDPSPATSTSTAATTTTTTPTATTTTTNTITSSLSKAKSKNKERMEDIDPKWKHFLENASLLDEIRKDVVRTHPDLQFFLEPNSQLGARRYAAIERILFIWAKLNKGVRYVQGMNEIVGTMYFVLANDENEEWASEAEADTYFLFNTLMVEMRDIFVPDLDDADTGIQGRMTNMLALLSLHDPEVRCHLDDCGIDPAFYSIRWLTTLLSREFLLPDTIRLWDSMFASTHKDNFMRYVCVCMVMIIREDLLKGDFGTCLRLLQSYPPTDVDQLLESSRALWIYESQVTLACHKGGISLSQALTTIAPPPAVIMAYGLNGGLALDQLERMRKEVMEAMAGKSQGGRFRGKASASASAAGKSFFGLFGSKK